ncbi:Branched-chain amino acid transport system permease protein OS=Castellaniella defragrans OX=75697 GN=HNR28_002445 PE=4 SV=1 [Castellaniella defragrans]
MGAIIYVALENKVGDLGRFLMQETGIQWFRVLGESVTIVIGLIFVICVMAFRRGIVGEWLNWRMRRQAGSQG